MFSRFDRILACDSDVQTSSDNIPVDHAVHARKIAFMYRRMSQSN